MPYVVPLKMQSTVPPIPRIVISTTHDSDKCIYYVEDVYSFLAVSLLRCRKKTKHRKTGFCFPIRFTPVSYISKRKHYVFLQIARIAAGKIELFVRTKKKKKEKV